MGSVVSQWPCVIKDKLSGLYAPKGWSYNREYAEWVDNLKSAKVYRNSAGAKNALRGAFDKFYRGPERDIEVVEFHKEYTNIAL